MPHALPSIQRGQGPPEGDRRALPLNIAWPLLVIASLGCASSPRGVDADLPAGSQRSYGYALLYELVSKQTGLGQALIMGSLSPASKEIIRQIATESKEAAGKIKALSEADPAIDLKSLGLPSAEVAARAALESAATGRLLFAGKRFETRLLLTQVDATEYGATLAKAVADLEDDAGRREWLKEFADRYLKLRDRVEGRLTASKPE